MWLPNFTITICSKRLILGPLAEAFRAHNSQRGRVRPMLLFNNNIKSYLTLSDLESSRTSLIFLTFIFQGISWIRTYVIFVTNRKSFIWNLAIPSHLILADLEERLVSMSFLFQTLIISSKKRWHILSYVLSQLRNCMYRGGGGGVLRLQIYASTSLFSRSLVGKLTVIVWQKSLICLWRWAVLCWYMVFFWCKFLLLSVCMYCNTCV